MAVLIKEKGINYVVHSTFLGYMTIASDDVNLCKKNNWHKLSKESCDEILGDLDQFKVICNTTDKDENGNIILIKDNN